MRVLWLYGPSGVGKSTTGWEVLNLLNERPGVRASYVDIDQLKMVYPEGEDDPSRERLAWSALSAVAKVYERFGATDLVVSGVLDPRSIQIYADAFGPMPLVFVRLTVDDAELKRRHDERGSDAELWAEVLEEARECERAPFNHAVVVASEKPPVEVARCVLAVAEGPSEIVSAELGAARDLPNPSGEQAVLVGGTRAIGKSSVAWPLFMATRGIGTRTAFLDLRQLGFVGANGGPANDLLQAAAVGSLWPVFRNAGAELLILNGCLGDARHLSLYRAALGETPLTYFELTATETALSQRVQARVSGQSPARLAGDDLSGLSDDDARLLVASALIRQRDSAAAQQADYVIDTTGLSPGDAAQRILTVWPHPVEGARRA